MLAVRAAAIFAALAAASVAALPAAGSPWRGDDVDLAAAENGSARQSAGTNVAAARPSNQEQADPTVRAVPTANDVIASTDAGGWCLRVNPCPANGLSPTDPKVQCGPPYWGEVDGLPNNAYGYNIAHHMEYLSQMVAWSAEHGTPQAIAWAAAPGPKLPWTKEVLNLHFAGVAVVDECPPNARAVDLSPGRTYFGNGEFAASAAKAFRDKAYLQCGISGDGQKKKVVFLSRHTPTRNIGGGVLEALKTRLGTVGVKMEERTTASDMSFCDQVHLFSGLDVMVAPHGQQLANSIFMPQGSLLIEAVEDGYSQDQDRPSMFYKQNRAADFSHRAIFCPSTTQLELATGQSLLQTEARTDSGARFNDQLVCSKQVDEFTGMVTSFVKNHEPPEDRFATSFKADMATEDAATPATSLATDPEPALKIYVYDNLPFGDQLFESNSLWNLGPGTSNVGAFQRSERKLHALITSNAASLTTDPGQADLLYMPIYPFHTCPWDNGLAFGAPGMACFMQTYEASVAKAKEIGTWNNGEKHFVPALFDTGMCGMKCSRDSIGNTPFEMVDYLQSGACFDLHQRPNDVLQWPSDVLGKAHAISFLGLKEGAFKYGECAHDTDAVVPPPINIDDESMAAAQQQTGRKRENKVYFRGSVKAWGETHVLRQKLVDMYSQKPGYLISGESAPTSRTVQEMSNSDFCLTPEGFAPWSFRLTEAMAVGCLPVVMDADKTRLPLSGPGGLDWSKFAVVLNSNELEQLDEKINEAYGRIDDMRLALASANSVMSMSGEAARGALMGELKAALRAAEPKTAPVTHMPVVQTNDIGAGKTIALSDETAASADATKPEQHKHKYDASVCPPLSEGCDGSLLVANSA